MKYQVNLVDANGRACVRHLGFNDVCVDAAEVERLLQHPENLANESALVRLARGGNVLVRQALFSRMEEDAVLGIVLGLAGDGDADAMEAVIRHADNPKCWEMLRFFAQRHSERAVDFVLGNVHREGGLLCAIELAEQQCPKARDYIRDLAGLIRLADKGAPFTKESLQAYKDYSPDCRERILRLG
ncbi:MAG: hypothetical protein IKC23_10955 [Fibrobacter sp.]|nr:hypothetical protein [Fibrobacter sp.]MBR2900121.1 hypothetical protein [Fibrobacter sp.]